MMSDRQNNLPAEAKGNKTPENRKETGADVKREAIRRAQWRMFVKFCAVLAALLAYMLLRGIEGEKSSYDEERSRPVVIVNDDDASKVAVYLERKRKGEKQSAGNQAIEKVSYDARLLRVSDVEKVFDKNPSAVSGTDFDEDTLRGVKETINKIRYQSFKDEKQIVGSLNEEILAYAEYQKRSLLATEEAESKVQASKLPGLTQEKLAVRARLAEFYRKAVTPAENKSTEDNFLTNFNAWIKQIKDKLRDEKTPDPTETEIKDWQAIIAGASSSSVSEDRGGSRGRRAKRGPTPPKNTLDEKDMVRWLTAIEKRIGDDSRLEDLKVRINEIDRKAQEQIRAVYTQLKPKLPELLRGAVNAPQKSDSWLSLFNPRSVLDEKSGVHVIYQTLRLACIMVLVFGLIFVLLLLLRPVPFVASGTDTLMEHAGELFKRSEGVAPQLAKSVIVTAAALGIGAAVAVAGSNSVSQKTYGGGGFAEASAQDEDGRPGAPGGKGNNGLPGAGGVDQHIVTLSPPIVVPSPINFNIPAPSVTFDTTRLGIIESDIGRLKEVTTTTLPQDTRLRIEALGQALDKRLQTLDMTAAKQEGRLASAESGVRDYYNWRTNVEMKFSNALDKFQEQLASTNSAVADLRDNSFELRQNSGGRNLLTRTMQIFKRDKYLIRSQSLKALKSMMIKSPPVVCPSPPDAATGASAQKRCCNNSPTTAEYSCDLDVDAIIRKLSSMVGVAPQSESDFMKELRAARRVDGATVGKLTVDRWKSIILNYTRVAY